MFRLAVLVVCLTGFLAQPGPEALVNRLLTDPHIKAAIAKLDADHERLTARTIALAEIPAPPFKETARAAAFLAMLRDAGLTDVEQDPEGNVLGLRRGTIGGPVVVVAAHLDSVFPPETDVRVRRNGTILSAPGIGDNARSLAVLVTIASALQAASVRTAHDLLFVGSVGEEGPGNLRGVKYLLSKGRYHDRVGAFVALDGAGSAVITHRGIGSRRYRMSFKGPGGHSFGGFGLVSPSFALAGAIQRISAMAIPSSPRTTYNVGLLGGGTSVNAIPSEVWADIDLRSEQRSGLDALDRQLAALARDAADEENRTRSTSEGPIVASLIPTGDRPSGETPLDSPLVQMAAAVSRALGETPTFEAGSTDANWPMSLGIPAIMIGSGGTGGRIHSLDEWLDVEKTSSLRGVTNALVLLVALAGLD